MTRVTTRQIRDDYGRWILKDNADRAQPIDCSHCGAHVRYVVQPLRLTLPQGIRPEATIAASRDQTGPDTDRLHYRPLGLNCGCYAKLHRQVAHIVENMKRRSKEPEPAQTTYSRRNPKGGR